MIRNQQLRGQSLADIAECNLFASQVFPGAEQRPAPVDEFAAVTVILRP
jgi:hypothetical protein